MDWKNIQIMFSYNVVYLIGKKHAYFICFSDVFALANQVKFSVTLVILETNTRGTSCVQEWLLSFIFPGRARIVYMSGMYNLPGELQLLTNVKIFLILYLEVYVSWDGISRRILRLYVMIWLCEMEVSTLNAVHNFATYDTRCFIIYKTMEITPTNLLRKLLFQRHEHTHFHD